MLGDSRSQCVAHFESDVFIWHTKSRIGKIGVTGNLVANGWLLTGRWHAQVNSLPLGGALANA